MIATFFAFLFLLPRRSAGERHAQSQERLATVPAVLCARRVMLPLLRRCLLVLSAATVVAAQNGARVCSQDDDAWPSAASVPLLNADNATAAAFFAPRSSTFDAPGDGVASWSLYSAALNSGMFCSWSSVEDQADSGDALAWRLYAERGTFAGITPPSLSMASYRNSSQYSFDYMPTGFVDANLAAGQWDSLQTLSLLSAFEYEDSDANGRYDPSTDAILSEFDLSTLLWDTPCASAGRGDKTVSPSGDSNSFSFRSRVFNPSFSTLRLTMVLEQSSGGGGDQQQATMPSGGVDGTEGIVVTSRNVGLGVTVEGFEYSSPTSMLGLRFALLTSRSTANSSAFAGAIDLTGASGVGGTGFNESATSGPIPTHLRNMISSRSRSGRGRGFDDTTYVAWQRSSSISNNASVPAVNVSLCALSQGNISEFKGANAQMFLAGAPARYNVDVQNFVLSFSGLTPSRASVSLTLGFGPVALPGPSEPESSSSHKLLYILLGSIGGGLALLAIVYCGCCRKTTQGTHAQTAYDREGAGGGGYGALVDESQPSSEAAWRRKNFEREQQNAAAAAAAAGAVSPPNRSASPAVRGNTQSYVDSNIVISNADAFAPQQQRLAAIL